MLIGNSLEPSDKRLGLIPYLDITGRVMFRITPALKEWREKECIPETTCSISEKQTGASYQSALQEPRAQASGHRPCHCPVQPHLADRFTLVAGAVADEQGPRDAIL